MKNGASTPIVWVRPVDSARAAALGSYSSASIASSTRMRVEPLTAPESLRTRETVPTPTPASAATLAIVLTIVPPVHPVPPSGSGSIQARRWSAVKPARCVSSAAVSEGSLSTSWWRDGVLYQIYPRSFGDSDGDGIGDLRGITARLDHLEWLGIDGIWLNPTMPSPNDDWGYDVADYVGVHPELGTLEDLDELIAEAGRRGIRVLLDLVPNHTSDRHAWFQDALGGRDAPSPRLLRLGGSRSRTARRRTTG